jgi:hypothetical protein
MAETVQVSEAWIKSVTELTFPASTDRRLQVLMDRNNEGLLSEDEKSELQALVEISEDISLVRAQAFRFLQQSPIR